MKSKSIGKYAESWLQDIILGTCSYPRFSHLFLSISSQAVSIYVLIGSSLNPTFPRFLN